MHVIEIDYTAPLTEIDAALDAHKNWLDCQYAAGLFLVSGGKDPRAGGIIIAADMPRDMIIAAVSTDPFAVRGLARRSAAGPAAAAVPSLRARTPPRIPPILLPHHSVLHFLPLMGGQ